MCNENPANVADAVIQLAQEFEKFKEKVTNAIAELQAAKDVHEGRIQELRFHANPTRFVLEDIKKELLAHQTDTYQAEKEEPITPEKLEKLSGTRFGLQLAIDEVDKKLVEFR